MNNIYKVLATLGIEEREVHIYLTLLEMGPSAIRKIAEKAEINRGTTYDILKKLQKTGMVSYFHKGKHEHFIAEDPQNLEKILIHKKNAIDNAEIELEKIIPELHSLSQGNINHPVVKFYEGYTGVRNILEDVLKSVSGLKNKKYMVYSSSTIRPYLYHKDAYPNFTSDRIKQKIHVRTIATGEGGNISGRDERKWLSKDGANPTYTLIYANKVAMISINKDHAPHGIIISDKGIYETQVNIFNSLWNKIN